MPLRHDPLFAGLWGSQFVSLLGDQLYLVGVVWFVSVKYGVSAAGVGLGLATSVPAIALGILAGTLVDRANRVLLMLGTCLARAVLVGMLAATLAAGAPPMFILFVGIALVAAAGVPFLPAVQAFLPVFAGSRSRLVRMDAALLTAQTIVGIIGPLVAGAAGALPVAVLLIIDAVSFLFPATAIWMIWRKLRWPQDPHRKGARAPFLRATWDGITCVFGNKVLRPQFCVYPLMESATYAVMVVLPAYVVHVMHASRSTFAYLLAAWALGRVVGFNLTRFTKLLKHRGLVLSSNFLLQGLAFMGFVSVRVPPLSMLALFCVGCPAGAATVAMTTYLQEAIPDELRGRTFAVLGTLPRFVMPLGPVAIGLVSQFAGLVPTLTSVAGLFLACGCFLASRPAIRSVT